MNQVEAVLPLVLGLVGMVLSIVTLAASKWASPHAWGCLAAAAGVVLLAIGSL